MRHADDGQLHLKLSPLAGRQVDKPGSYGTGRARFGLANRRKVSSHDLILRKTAAACVIVWRRTEGAVDTERRSESDRRIEQRCIGRGMRHRARLQGRWLASLCVCAVEDVIVRAKFMGSPMRIRCFEWHEKASRPLGVLPGTNLIGEAAAQKSSRALAKIPRCRHRRPKRLDRIVPAGSKD